MNKRTRTFEIGSIALLLLLGMSLPTFAIDNTGILTVAGLLSLFFVVNHHKAFLRFLRSLAPKTAWSPAPTNSRSES